MFCVPCETYARKSSSLAIGSDIFKLDSFKSHECSISHIDACKAKTIERKKANSVLILQKWCNGCNTTLTSGFNQPAGCHDVVSALDLTLRKLNESQKQQLTVCFNTAYCSSRCIPQHSTCKKPMALLCHPATEVIRPAEGLCKNDLYFWICRL